MSRFEVDVDEVEYLRHGDKPFAARLFRPRGKGPFPAVVEAHGGAWVEGNRRNNDAINERVARGGVVVAALDFRVPPEASYPASVADVNYAVRWMKANAERFSTAPDKVGTMGTSSGGHLAVLSAMKPADPRYAAIPSSWGTDARVKYVVTLWPVICPIGRYLDRRRRDERGERHPTRTGGNAMQEKYWLTEEAMAEGSPLKALERGDAVELPNILYLQNKADTLHPRPLMEEFVELYRKAGGKLELELFEGEAYDLVRTHPESDAAKESIEKIVRFIHRQAG